MTQRQRAPKPSHHDRRDRRATVDVLLGRMLRGVLTPAEAALLAEHARTEQRLGDATRKSLGETTRALAKNREAADDAIREMEQRAVDAEEQLRMYRAVEEQRQQTEATALRTWRENARKYRSDLNTAEATLNRVRTAPSLGDALAAVAAYDGLSPEQVAIHTAFAKAADSPRALLDEQAREHAIALATERRRGDGWKRHALDADHKADRYRTAWLAARRDRRADRAAMAAELPDVIAGQQTRAAGITATEATRRVRRYAAAGIPAAQFATTTEQPR
ncbi:hypothetical protein [Streptomyces sp. GQFP]|uniref:hypothetical protein n=1 Tax=Streptomyces sp. GQFP TaxID=2907545 RepID=UPI001F2C2C52|nr:hypothetical protein [Streptomyces sp. GQFP]UIX33563.1 hypothetical protein LUX31_28140 [Streptomyces sp. GQFP]